MHDIRAAVDAWLAAGRRVALATVLSAWGSAPRKSGAALAVVEGGDFAGSVTAGCVEGAVIEAALEILSGAPPRRLGYRVSDDRAWSLGLACGGEIALWVAPLDAALWRSAWAAVDARQAAVWSTVVGGPQEWLGGECLTVGAHLTVKNRLRMPVRDRSPDLRRPWGLWSWRPCWRHRARRGTLRSPKRGWWRKR